MHSRPRACSLTNYPHKFSPRYLTSGTWPSRAMRLGGLMQVGTIVHEVAHPGPSDFVQFIHEYVNAAT